MTESQTSEFLKRVKEAVTLGRAVAVCAFGLGVWITTMQLRVTNVEANQSDFKTFIVEARQWREKVVADTATTNNELKNLNSKLDNLLSEFRKGKQ